MSFIKQVALVLGSAALFASAHVHAATNLAPTGVASASATVAGSSAAFANDGDLSTAWIAGDRATQSFFLNFSAPVTAGSINALIEQSPSGITKEEVYLDNKWAFTWYGDTKAGDWLTYSFDTPVSFSSLEIRTTESPSWIAWREVQVMSADLPAPAPVPEPESWAMFGLGLAALGVVAKRKKQA